MLFSRLKELGESEYRKLMNRSVDIQKAIPIAKEILKNVEKKGDEALREYSKKFEGAEIRDFKVSKKEFDEAEKIVGDEFLQALNVAKKNIEDFHKHQLKEWFYERDGIKVGQVARPIETVGCYIPKGKRGYPSTVLMTAIPARIAGVKKIVCITPPTNGKASAFVLVACKIMEISDVYKIGGAQGIGALAFGTESVPKVDKIVGPGNIYVSAAKKLVSHIVAVDIPAGPSEILILADESANPEYVALDMAAQAEHDPTASCVLVTDSPNLAKKVRAILMKDIAIKNGAIIIVENIEEGVNFANEYAPEHLEIIAKNAKDILPEIKNAGAIFIGNYTPVACGDYISGPSHVLPTGGSAKVYSGLSVYDFLKFISVQEVDKNALKRLSKDIITLAKAEGFIAHAESIGKRFK